MQSRPETVSSGAALFDPAIAGLLERISFTQRRIVGGRLQGDRKSPKKGSGVEFADFREYSPGDDIRRVDWNLYARTEKLFIKLYTMEEDRSVSILTDCSKSMATGEPDKFLYAQRLAAAFAYVALSGMDRLRLFGLSGQEIIASEPLRGRQHMQRALAFLAGLKPEAVGGPSEAISRFLAAQQKPGMAIIISDFFQEGVQDSFKGFAARGFDAAVIQTLSPQDKSPDIAGDLRLIDCETGDSKEVSITAGLLAKYAKALESLQRNLDYQCRHYGLAFLPVSTRIPLSDLFTRALLKAGVVV